MNLIIIHLVASLALRRSNSGRDEWNCRRQHVSSTHVGSDVRIPGTGRSLAFVAAALLSASLLCAGSQKLSLQPDDSLLCTSPRKVNRTYEFEYSAISIQRLSGINWMWNERCMRVLETQMEMMKVHDRILSQIRKRYR